MGKQKSPYMWTNLEALNKGSTQRKEKYMPPMKQIYSIKHDFKKETFYIYISNEMKEESEIRIQQ